MSKKKKKKREKLRKMDMERNRGKVYCTIRGDCEGPCKEANFRRFSRICSEAFYRTPEGEIAVKVVTG